MTNITGWLERSTYKLKDNRRITYPALAGDQVTVALDDPLDGEEVFSLLKELPPESLAHLRFAYKPADGPLYLAWDIEPPQDRVDTTRRVRDVYLGEPTTSERVYVEQPGNGKSKEKIGYVYFLQFGNDGPIKIGYSKSIERRIPELTAKLPEKPQLVGYIKEKRHLAMELEAHLHQKFSRHRTRGEWFDIGIGELAGLLGFEWDRDFFRAPKHDDDV